MIVAGVSLLPQPIVTLSETVLSEAKHIVRKFDLFDIIFSI